MTFAAANRGFIMNPAGYFDPPLCLLINLLASCSLAFHSAGPGNRFSNLRELIDIGLVMDLLEQEQNIYLI